MPDCDSLCNTMGSTDPCRPNSVRLQNDRKRLAEEGAPPRLDLLVKELRKMTRQIHVAFIFDNSYGSCDTWHILMCMLNSTAVNGPKINGDWQAFSNELGLNYQQIKSIENVQPGFEDPVTNSLLAFAQKQDATLDRIIDALDTMGREDILLKISNPLTEMCEKVINKTSTDSSMITSDSGFSESESTSVIKPNYIPSVPCLLRNKEDLHFNMIYSCFKANLTPTLCKTAQVGESFEHNMLIQSPDEGFENEASPPSTNSEESDVTIVNFDVTVLLTFASDGQETAQQIARVLRATTNSRGQHVGVVILEEQQQFLNADPQACVRGVFEQVDFVVPVITAEYLEAIKPNSEVDSSSSLDAEYTRFIYKLMEHYFTSNSCVNRKIRAILPTATENSIVNKLKQNPIFRPYNWYESLISRNIAKKICLRKF